MLFFFSRVTQKRIRRLFIKYYCNNLDILKLICTSFKIDSWKTLSLVGAAFAGYLNFPVQAVQRKVPAFFNPLSRELDNGRYAGVDDCEILAEIRRGFDSFDKCRRRSLEQASFAPQNILNFFFVIRDINYQMTVGCGAEMAGVQG